MFGVRSHKDKAGATYSCSTAMAKPVFWVNNTFQLKRAHTAANRNWKVWNNCSLLYSTNSPPAAVVSSVHAWMLNTELETGLEIYKRTSFEDWTRGRLMLPLLKPHCRSVVPKLFLIACHLWVPCCQHVPPCFRKSQCAKYNLIKSLENQN